MAMGLDSDTRLQHLDRIREIDTNGEARALYRAMTACLRPNEAVMALLNEVHGAKHKRRALLRRVGEHMDAAFEPCHADLVQRLNAMASDGKQHARLRPAQVLYALLPSMPADTGRDVLRLLLGSKYLNVRRKAYRALKDAWDDDLAADVVQVWRQHRDYDCTTLLAGWHPVPWLLENRHEIVAHLADGRALTKLYLRLTATEPHLATELRDENGLSYAYLCVKAGRTISNNEALALFERYQNDENVGLLVWCFGQMGLWDLLIKILDRGTPWTGNAEPYDPMQECLL